MPVRKGSRRIRVYNSAQLAFVYDHDHLDALTAGCPLVDGDVADEVVEAHEGCLVVWELEDDDELDVELVVGEPLSEKELKKTRWMTPQVTRLHVPSGRLVFESVDTARFLEEPPQDKGKVLEVAPGDYAVTLHRVHWDARMEYRPYRGAPLVLALTPAADAGELPTVAGVLPDLNEPMTQAFKELVLQDLTAKSGSTRNRAVFELPAVGRENLPDGVKELLVAMKDDRHKHARANAVTALCKLYGDEGRELARAFFEDKDRNVQISIMDAFRNHRWAAGIQELLHRNLEHEDEEVKNTARRRLGFL